MIYAVLSQCKRALADCSPALVVGLGFLLAGCVETIPKFPVAEQPAGAINSVAAPTRVASRPGWVGDWIGTLDCGKGPVRLKLMLTRHQDPMLGVRGEILSIAGKQPGGVPSFSMNGDAQGSHLRMRWERWAYKPLSDRQLNFDGNYLAANDKLVLQTTDGSCKPLEMTRVTLEDLAPPAAQQAPMTYADLIKTLQGTKGAEAKARRLTGKKITLTLRATSPQALMVDPKDLVFFSCNQRAASFKGGKLTATIVGYEESYDGDPSILLDRCGS